MGKKIIRKKTDPLDSLVQQNIKQYPSFANVYGPTGEKLAIKADSSYVPPDDYGSIEYFSPTQDTVRYSDTYKVPHPSPGKHALLYNPKNVGNAPEAILGDMFHGMNYDPEFSKLKSEFSEEAKKASVVTKEGLPAENLLSNSKYHWQQDYNKNPDVDPFDQYWSNDMDGRIRQLFQPDHPDHAQFMREMSPSMKTVGDKIVNYMKTGKPPKQVKILLNKK
jgi:hypothetical protein